jgi:hypothetical protein
MQRNTRARILAVAALLVALGVGLARRGGRSEGAAGPVVTAEDAISASIYDTMNAARAGDVSRYLAGYTGPMRAALQRLLDDDGDASFARYLLSLDAGLKGLAVSVESCVCIPGTEQRASRVPGEGTRRLANRAYRGRSTGPGGGPLRDANPVTFQ